MSARRLGHTDVFQPVTVQARATRLSLPAGAVRFRRIGVEFHSQHPFPLWAEMTVELQPPQATRRFHSNGVVVECRGNRHAGYDVTVVFTSMSRQAQARLTSLANSALA